MDVHSLTHDTRLKFVFTYTESYINYCTLPHIQVDTDNSPFSGYVRVFSNIKRSLTNTTNQVYFNSVHIMCTDYETKKYQGIPSLLLLFMLESASPYLEHTVKSDSIVEHVPVKWLLNNDLTRPVACVKFVILQREALIYNSVYENFFVVPSSLDATLTTSATIIEYKDLLLCV